MDLSPLERSLERLGELVERLVALIPDVAARPPNPHPPGEQPLAGHERQDDPAGHVLFVGGPSGYRLVERDGGPPARRDAFEWEGTRYAVVRLGPSPLPADQRPCAFLELLPRRSGAGDGLP